MTLGPNITSRISPSSAKTRCHGSPLSHALIEALQAMTSGSVFASHVSLSCDRVRGHWPPFPRALTSAL